MSMLDDVIAFHEKFGLTYEGPPRVIDGDLLAFRDKFHREENTEFLTAMQAGDLNKALDALADEIYVVLGSVYLSGFASIFEIAWADIHEKNMLKERASSRNPSKRGFNDIDVVKPAGWVSPNHQPLIDQATFDHGRQRRLFIGETCPDCGSPQFTCPSGVVCKNGHGY